MIINRDHRRWAITSAAIAGVAAAIYGWQLSSSPAVMSGGSWSGLVFGAAATLLMAVAGLLTARRRLRTRRLGSAQSWVKAHIWCGLLAVPFVWFHSGFEFGGLLTSTIMVLFYVVVASGAVGLLLQHVVPSRLTTEVPLETVHGQIEDVRRGLAVDAYELVAAVTGPLEDAEEERRQIAFESELAASPQRPWKLAPRVPSAAEPRPGADRLRKVYLDRVRPFLHGKKILPPFAELTTLSLDAPDEWRFRAIRLAEICEEVRQLRRQRQLQRWLHLWLYTHAPVSLALFLLVGLHIIFALRYAWVDLP